MNRNTGIAVILCGFVIILLAFMVFNFFRSQYYSEAPAMVFGSGGKEVVLFLEALSRIQEEGLFLEPGTPSPKIIQDTLKSYLVQKDPFSDYLSRDEFLRFKQLQGEHYVGIGMEIERKTAMARLYVSLIREVPRKEKVSVPAITSSGSRAFQLAENPCLRWHPWLEAYWERKSKWSFDPRAEGKKNWP